jgi:Tol biopolymer transport system component
MAIIDKRKKTTKSIFIIPIVLIMISVIAVMYILLTPRSSISKGIKLTAVDGYSVDSWSPDGKLLMYHAGDDISGFDYVLAVRANGKNKTLIAKGNNAIVNIKSCSWFPDSKRVAYVMNYDDDNYCELWINDIVRKEKKRILRLKDSEITEIEMSPNGKVIAYVQVPSGKDKEVWVVGADGKNNRKLISGLVSGDNYSSNLRWHPNGKSLYYVKQIEAKAKEDDYSYVYDLYAIDIDGKNNRLILGHLAIGTESLIKETEGGGYRLSADGKQILYSQWSGVITTVNSDGSNKRNLNNGKSTGVPPLNEINLDWTAICNGGKDSLEIIDLKQEEKPLMIEQPHTLYEDVLGYYTYGGVAWSPNGNKIAYVRKFYKGPIHGLVFATVASSKVWIADINKAR